MEVSVDRRSPAPSTQREVRGWGSQLALGALVLLVGAAAWGEDLVNPSFDGGVAGWQTFGTTHAHSQQDARGDGTGSVRIVDDAPIDNGGFSAISQCVPAFPTAPYQFGARSHVPYDQQPDVRVVVLVRFYDTTNCVGGQIVGEAGSPVLDRPGNWWPLVGERVVAPIEARGVQVSVGVRRVGDQGVGEAYFDDVFLEPVLGNCEPSSQVACLNDGRFSAEVSWTDFSGNSGTGRAVPLTTDGASFWFFDAENQELLVKVIDGCALNDRVWVFAAATTNVAYDLRVVDTQTGVEKLYRNPLGTAAPAITDTNAFAGCGGSPGGNS